MNIIKKYNIKAKKSLWQNFLVDEEVLEEIVFNIEVNWKNIVEVWPWYGALTEKILKEKPKSLNLVELDNDMVDILEKRLSDGDFELDWIDFKINNIDVLKYSPPARGELEGEYFLVANIPYYITSPILRHFLYEVENIPEKMLILMQKDVWDKILLSQKNKKPKSSVLSLYIDKKCEVSEVLVVPNTSFVPAPKVESSVLYFESHDLYKDVDDKQFLELIKLGFREPRKMLTKNLINSGYDKEYIIQLFEELSIEKNIRPEALEISKWCQLTKVINNNLTTKTWLK